MRKVQFKAWIPIRWPEGANSANQHTTHNRVPGTGCWEEGFSREGLFHKWGNAYEEFESGPGNYTVGLVELSDGEIVEVLPSHLKFVDLPLER
jgi:hypothetical protein